MPESSYYPISNDRKLLEKPAELLSDTNRFPFQASKAYAIRLQAFANGAIYVIENGSMTPEKKSAAIELIKEVTKKKLDEIQRFQKDSPPRAEVLRNELDSFIDQLEKASGLKRKAIALGEAFWVWQEYERPPERKTETLIGDLRVVEIEEPMLAPLTQEQKTDLQKIHSQDETQQPAWFLKLDAWAQKALKDILKDQPENWDKYQKSIPATLRNIPGQSNATKHTLEIMRGENLISTSIAYKQGVPSAFEMPKKNTAKSAVDNLEQMLNALEQSRQAGFRSYWGVEEADRLQQEAGAPPILLGGLLTPKEQGGFISNVLDRLGVSGKENNTKFHDEKTAALESYKAKDSGKGKNIFNLNVAVNNQRSTTPITVDRAFLEHAEKIEKLVTGSKAPPEKVERLSAAVKALREHDDLLPPSGRNKNLHLAALYDVTTRLMGGVSTGNCKSSKDRKGVEVMMADAMMIYHAKNETFPNCSDTDPERQNFIDIFVALYNRGHQLSGAHDNSPGSAGIKDEGILDKDIKEALGESYRESKEIADFNKPQSFFDKHHKKIQPFLGALAIIATAATAILLATGVLAPAALITGAVAVNLGAGPLVAGIASAVGAAVISAAGAGLLYFGIERVMNYDKRNQTLEAQGLLDKPVVVDETVVVAEKVDLTATKADNSNTLRTGDAHGKNSGPSWPAAGTTIPHVPQTGSTREMPAVVPGPQAGKEQKADKKPEEEPAPSP